jgi:hypothetical protein
MMTTKKGDKKHGDDKQQSWSGMIKAMTNSKGDNK